MQTIQVQIVTYNSGKYISACIRALHRSRYPLKIYIVDNGSTDRTLQKIRELDPKIPIVEMKKNVGFAAAHNYAGLHAKADFLLILNPDTVVSPNFAEPLIQAMQNREVAACQPLVYLPDKKRINLTGKQTHYLGLDWIRDYLSITPSPAGQINSMSGCAVLLRRSSFLKAGGFDPHYFMYYEDTDLSWRLRLLGKKLLFCPESIVTHDYEFAPTSDKLSLTQKLYWNERNRIITVLKNYHWRTIFLLSPAFLLLECALWGYFILNGWGKIKWSSYTGILREREHIFKEREKNKQLRKTTDKEIFLGSEKSITFVYFSHPLVTYIVNPILQVYAYVIQGLI